MSLFFVDALMKKRCLAKIFDEPGCLTIKKIQSQRDGHEPLRKSFASCRTVNKFSFYLSFLVLEHTFWLCLLEKQSEEKFTNFPQILAKGKFYPDDGRYFVAIEPFTLSIEFSLPFLNEFYKHNRINKQSLFLFCSSRWHKVKLDKIVSLKHIRRLPSVKKG